MKIVIPVSSFDAHLLDDFVALFRALGGAPRQDVFLLPTRSMLSKAKLAAEAMQARCRSCAVIEWDKDNAEVQPIAGNLMWQHAVVEMGKQENQGNRQPWYFMELDNTLLKPGCFDAMESEYAMSGCSYMGAIAPSRVRLADGTITTEVHIPGQPPNIPFMVGTGIYPVGVPKLTDGQWLYAKYESWDKFLRFYMSRSLHATKLIQHRWKTCNYRREGDQIICDNDPSNPDKTDNAGPVDGNAYVLHGCKDGSLAKLVLESLKMGIIPESVQAVPPPIFQSTEPPKPSPESNSKWEQVGEPATQAPKGNPSEVKYDNASWSAFQHKVSSDKEFAVIASEKEKVEQEKLNQVSKSGEKVQVIPLEELKAPEPMDISSAVLSTIQSSKTKLRLAQVAGLTGLSQELIRQETMKAGCKFSIGKGGLAWMSLNEEPSPKKKVKVKL